MESGKCVGQAVGLQLMLLLSLQSSMSKTVNSCNKGNERYLDYGVGLARLAMCCMRCDKNRSVRHTVLLHSLYACSPQLRQKSACQLKSRTAPRDTPEALG